MPIATLHDGRQVHLGRIKPKSRPQALRLSPYVNLATANLPASVDYSPKAMPSINLIYLNQQYGDCVIASSGHSLGVWSGNKTGTAITATDQEIGNIYFYFSPHDSGCVISQVLDYWVATGLKLGGSIHKIDGYVQLDWTNQDLVKFAINAFGGVKIGFDIPNAWASGDPSVPWDLTDSRIVGGHDVLCVGYDANYVTVATWGALRKITWRAFLSKTYLDEAYAMLSPEWYGSDNLSPAGLNLTSLKDDLQKVGQGTIPPLNPDPTPTPGPIPTPTPTPTGLTLDQAIKAVEDAIDAGRPYGVFNVMSKVEDAAVAGLKKAWPNTPAPDPNDLNPGDFNMGGE